MSDPISRGFVSRQILRSIPEMLCPRASTGSKKQQGHPRINFASPSDCQIEEKGETMARGCPLLSVLPVLERIETNATKDKLGRIDTRLHILQMTTARDIASVL